MRRSKWRRPKNMSEHGIFGCFDYPINGATLLHESRLLLLLFVCCWLLLMFRTMAAYRIFGAQLKLSVFCLSMSIALCFRIIRYVFRSTHRIFCVCVCPRQQRQRLRERHSHTHAQFRCTLFSHLTIIIYNEFVICAQQENYVC